MLVSGTGIGFPLNVMSGPPSATDKLCCPSSKGFTKRDDEQEQISIAEKMSNPNLNFCIFKEAEIFLHNVYY